MTPLDAQGHRGAQSRIASFTWEWPSQTTAKLTDLRAEPETFDPQFSWTPVAGAAKYEVEVSYSRDFAPGSKVCCDKAVIGTSHSPTQPLPDNTYYWRVRAIDVDGNVGVWNPSSADASRFEKVFDKAAALGRPSWLAVPGFVLRLIVGEMAGIALLNGQRVAPRRALDGGFSFEYPDVTGAMRAAVRLR